MGRSEAFDLNGQPTRSTTSPLPFRGGVRPGRVAKGDPIIFSGDPGYDRALAGRGGSQSDPSGYALYPFKVPAGATVRVVDEPTLKRPAVESMPCAEDPAHLEKWVKMTLE
ncbi:hypothetical protein BHE74_00001120 [Ensete ventricosum]|nr:hypothetical protein BHE74_00001120 [Ensete ventricosum]